MADIKDALRSFQGSWRRMIEAAKKSKKPFQDDADECRKFFNGPYNFLYGMESRRGDFVFSNIREVPQISIGMTVNKVAEGVQLFGPVLYHNNPGCKVNPRRPPMVPPEAFGDPNDPIGQMMAQQSIMGMQKRQLSDSVRSILMESYLNYLPDAINLKRHSRHAIDEAIIKGNGVLWAVMDKPASGPKMPILEYDTQDNLLIDPDHESLRNAKWVMRKFVRPTWQVEAERGLKPGTIKGTQMTTGSFIGTNSRSSIIEADGHSNDLLTYWGVWSKMGLGGLLKDASEKYAEWDQFGRYIYMEICESCDFFLNVPESIMGNDAEIRRRLQWETPFWCDAPTSNGWPFVQFAFHHVPGELWPMSHFKPGLGELKFINWAYSFLISGVQKRSRDFLAVPKSASEEIKRQILEGTDLTMIEVESMTNLPLDQIVKFIQHPEMYKGLFEVIAAVERNFEKRVGLNELMYGLQERQDRSATESKMKENFVNIRPDDMATQVEESMTDGFRKLALMARWHMTGQDVSQVFGAETGMLWDKYVTTADVAEIMHLIEYRIEAGSARKPNKSKDEDDAKSLMQNLFAPLFEFAKGTGNVGPVNSLLKFYGKVFDIDVGGMLLPNMPPPPPPGPPQGAPPPPEVPRLNLGVRNGQR